MGKGNYDRIMKLPKYLKKDFSWWLHNISTCKNDIPTPNYKNTIFTDASTTD